MGKRELLVSAVWAGAISVPISLFGAAVSMALAHSGGIILVLFMPAMLALSVCDDVCSDVVTYSAALVAQFVAYFLIVLLVRAVLRRRKSNAEVAPKEWMR